MNLNDDDLITSIIATHPAQLSHPSASAIASTVSRLQKYSNNSLQRSNFIPDSLLLLPPSLTGSSTPPSDSTQLYLHQLVLSAEAAATTRMCSSLLAGQGSESDDTGDIAFWLGKGNFSRGNQQAVLDTLGLAGWATSGQLAAAEFTLDDILAQVVQLKNHHGFKVKVGSVVLFFLVGCVEQGGQEGWGGLIGIGTWSD